MHGVPSCSKFCFPFPPQAGGSLKQKRDIDIKMERTKNRPLVTGLISPRNGLIFAISLEIVAFLVLWAGTNLLSGILALSATLFYVFVYSLWLKRTSKQNIVIGGAAGAVPVLVGWAAVTNSLSWTPWLLFLVIFLWTPPHFWAPSHQAQRRLHRGRRTDAAVGGIPRKGNCLNGPIHDRPASELATSCPSQRYGLGLRNLGTGVRRGFPMGHNCTWKI